MTGKEYFDLTGEGRTGEEAPFRYEKPDFLDIDNKRDFLDQMMQNGFLTLVDVFAVVQNEHLFNVFNSETKKVEEFDPSKESQYSQSQCAIAIERVFSRIYKYLQFKSTTSETFQRHINIDSGYKYLTTDSLKKSDHDLGIYYDPEDEEGKNYLRYLTKLKTYENNRDVLDENERAVLKEFNLVLSKQTMDWLDKKWDLCPLLQRASEKIDELSPRKLMSKLLARDGGASATSDATEDRPTEHALFINFEKNRFMKQDWHAEGNITISNTLTHEWISNDVLRINLESGAAGIDLSKVVLAG